MTRRERKGRSDRRDERPARPRGGERGRSGVTKPAFPDQLEGRNVVLVALQCSGRVREIWIDERARPDPKLGQLRGLAAERGLVLRAVPRQQLDAVSEAGVHNGVIAFADGLQQPTLKQVLDEVEDAGRDPFVLLLDEVQYEQNLGAILRTAACAGVDAVVIPTRRGASLSPVVQRIAMGGAEVVPVVRSGLMSAVADLRRRGVRLVGAEADGLRAYSETDMSGPLALVIGGEHRGLGQKLREKCDETVHIPLPVGAAVTSLNASVAAGLLIFERVRQLRS